MSPRSKEQNAIIKDERREQLLLAALKVFAHKGLAATKIGDIAAATGLSHGLVYHYFASKDDIYLELVRRAITISSSLMQQLDQLELSPLGKLRAIADATLQGIDENEEGAYYFYLMQQAMASDTGIPVVRELIGGFTVPMEVTVRAILQGQQVGEVQEGDPVEFAVVFWSAIQGLAIQKIVAGAGFRMPGGSLLVRMLEKRQ